MYYLKKNMKTFSQAANVILKNVYIFHAVPKFPIFCAIYYLKYVNIYYYKSLRKGSKKVILIILEM